jgi:DNA processing protein
VVEAAVQSGSLITARMALEGGREVFAIPGSIHAPQSRGCHALIRQGAKLVECGQDILEELQLSARPGPVDPADAEREGLSDEADASQGGPHAALLYALGLDPVSLDALAARTGWPTSQLNIELLDLELQGQVARLPGQLFQRRMAG